ncbi:MAG: glycosyltransferase involved in cell wall biosynthesis, partial [Gammaproteobacteria bacterium]
MQLSDAGNGAIGVTIIIPAFNEARTILTLLQRVAKQNVDGISFDVLVVDDGSTDETVAILEANPQMYGQLIKLETNRGKGGAVIAGLKAAKGDYVLFQDADLEYDPADY